VGAHAPGQKQENLWYAFVDLQETEHGNGWQPLVFFTPSIWVGTFVKADWKRKLFMLHKGLWPECQGRWDRVASFLDGRQEAREWATAVPEDLEW
jgi:hypothetical protein